MSWIRTAGRDLAETVKNWSKDNASFLAAGLSYFTVFSLAPLLILAVAVAGIVLGNAAAEGLIVQQLAGIVGDTAANAVQSLVLNARQSGMKAATAVGIAALFFGASALFLKLQVALNMIFKTEPQTVLGGLRHKLVRILIKRLITFALVCAVGVLVIFFFFIDAMLGVVRNFLGGTIPLLNHLYLWSLLNFAVSLVFLTVMSAAIFKFLPDRKIRWRDVWVGSTVTAVLLGLGRVIITVYFRFSDPGSVYGVVGSLLVVFIAIYLSAQIFLFGAEFTCVYAHRHGSLKKATLPEDNPRSLQFAGRIR